MNLKNSLNGKKMYFLDPDQTLDFQIDRWQKSIKRWQNYSTHWDGILSILIEKLKDQCLPELQRINIQNDIEKANKNLKWAKDNIEILQNSLNFYQKKTQQNAQPISPSINQKTTGKPGEPGKDGGLGPIVKSKKCL